MVRLETKQVEQAVWAPDDILRTCRDKFMFLAERGAYYYESHRLLRNPKMVMTDGEALRKAIVSAPDGDAPRLIYADWLDENGQPDRAAFVRAQIEASRAEPYTPAARDAEARAERLLKPNVRQWSRHLYGHVLEEPGFRRGFIEHVALEALGFDSAFATVLEKEPVQSLRLVRPEESDAWISFESVFESSRLASIRRLEFSSRRGFLDHEYQGMLKCPHLRGVRALSFRDCGIQPSMLFELFRSDAFPELSELNVSGTTHVGAGLHAAVMRSQRRKLLRLHASGVAFASDHLREILTSPMLKQVEELWLASDGLERQRPVAELEIGWVFPWQRLAVLELSGQHLGDDAARAIAAQRDTRALRYLGLADNDLSMDAVSHLIRASHLSLYYLDIRNNGLPAMASAKLKDRFPEALVLR